MQVTREFMTVLAVSLARTGLEDKIGTRKMSIAELLILYREIREVVKERAYSILSTKHGGKRISDLSPSDATDAMRSTVGYMHSVGGKAIQEATHQFIGGYLNKKSFGLKSEVRNDRVLDGVGFTNYIDTHIPFKKIPGYAANVEIKTSLTHQALEKIAFDYGDDHCYIVCAFSSKTTDKLIDRATALGYTVVSAEPCLHPEVMTLHEMFRELNELHKDLITDPDNVTLT